MSDPTTRDPIDEAIEESFPASDPPEWTQTHAGAPWHEANRAADLRTIRVHLPLGEALDRIEQALAAAGMKVFARIDQAAEARAVGLSLRPTVLLLFGNPRGGTPIMDGWPTAALELPLKALLWDAEGVTWLAYNTPMLLTQRHGVAPAVAGTLSPAGQLLERAVGGPA